MSVPMLGTVICSWSGFFTRLPSPTWLLSRHRLAVAEPEEPLESAGTRLAPVGFSFSTLAPALQRRCQANPPVIQHLPIDVGPPFRLFRNSASWRGRQPRATTGRRVMLAWLRSAVPAGRCKPTGSPRRAGTRPVRWNCQDWRCGFGFCGRVALDHIMADYQKIHLPTNLPHLVIF